MNEHLLLLVRGSDVKYFLVFCFFFLQQISQQRYSIYFSMHFITGFQDLYYFLNPKAFALNCSNP